MAPSADDEGIASEWLGDSQDPRITTKLVEVLSQAPVLFDRLTSTSRAGGRAGSAAATDEASPLGHHVRIMAIDHLMAGIDHLVMWNRHCDAPRDNPELRAQALPLLAVGPGAARRSPNSHFISYATRQG